MAEAFDFDNTAELNGGTVIVNGEEEFLASIDDDDEYEKVAGFFLQRLQDAIDSDDYDDFDVE